MASGLLECRPFAGLERSEELIGGFFFMVNGSALHPQEVIHLPDETYRRSVIVLHHVREGRRAEFKSLLSEAIETSGLAPEDLSLVLTARMRRLKQVTTLKTWSMIDLMSGLEPMTVASPTKASQLLETPKSGAELTLHLLLNKQITPEPLRPWRKGTWLARATFRIDTANMGFVFTPYPLDDEARMLLSLPPGTLRYIEVGSPLDKIGDETAIRFWIDQQLLREISAERKSGTSQFLQRQFFLDAIGAIVQKAISDPAIHSASAADLEATLIGRLLEWIGGLNDGSSDEARSRMRQIMREELIADPARLLAQAEARVPDMRSDLISTLAER